MANPFEQIATSEAISYAISRSVAVERQHPMLALVYRAVADVLHVELERLQVLREREAAQGGEAA